MKENVTGKKEWTENVTGKKKSIVVESGWEITNFEGRICIRIRDMHPAFPQILGNVCVCLLKVLIEDKNAIYVELGL